MEPQVIIMDDESRVAEARRTALKAAGREGLDESRASDAAIIATELANNLLRHAKGGEIQVHRLTGSGFTGLEIISIDRGPGIVDIQQCLTDGYSTGGTSGTGLGAVQRLATQVDVHSIPGRGTIVCARVLARAGADAPAFRLGAAGKPLAGETLSGDAWASRSGQDFALVMLADGLGHGVQASEASGQAVRSFLKATDVSPVELLNRIHGALRGTRGAAVSIAKIEFEQKRVVFAGVGNVSGVVIGTDAVGMLKQQSMVSCNGTAGHEVRQIKEFLYPFRMTDTIVMHSDGLSTHWNLQDYPGLLRKSPSVVAAVLYRDHARLRDDACVVVGKMQ